jgi:hypothetical protein
LKHRASPEYWKAYRSLPTAVQRAADRAYELLKRDPHHPSLHFKKIRQFYSVRIGLRHRVLGVPVEDGIVWFWIGSHADYDKLIA